MSLTVVEPAGLEAPYFVEAHVPAGAHKARAAVALGVVGATISAQFLIAAIWSLVVWLGLAVAGAGGDAKGCSPDCWIVPVAIVGSILAISLPVVVLVASVLLVRWRRRQAHGRKAAA